MNLNENRRVRNPEYIDVQSGWDYLRKVARLVWQGDAVHVRVNGETKKGYFLALTALLIARLGQRPAFLTYVISRATFPRPKARCGTWPSHCYFEFPIAYIATVRP